MGCGLAERVAKRDGESIARFATTFSALLRSGIPALAALKIVGRAIDNVILEEVLEDVAKGVVEGSDMSTVIRKERLFPPVVGYMAVISTMVWNCIEKY